MQEQHQSVSSSIKSENSTVTKSGLFSKTDKQDIHEKHYKLQITQDELCH